MPEWLKPGSVVALLGAVSALLIGYRILHHPAASEGFGGFHMLRSASEVGIWLGFAARRWRSSPAAICSLREGAENETEVKAGAAGVEGCCRHAGVHRADRL